MIITTHGIVLRAIKYSETSFICDIFTEERGMQSYIVSGVRKKKAKISPSLLQVMSIVELVAYHKDGRELNRITELKSAFVFQQIPFDVVRGAVGLFMTELVQKTVQEHEENQPLYDFLYQSFTFLDETTNGIANIHVVFMVQLTSYLGFMMDDNRSETMPYFDAKEGRFKKVRTANQDGLNEELSEVLYAFGQLPLSDSHLVKLSRDNRKTLVKVMMRYYQHRIDSFSTLNSFQVLQEVF